MDRRPEIGFSSYDRLFPSQDTVPAGGSGNLIALPLQRSAREQGNSLFVDDNLRPFDDQWAYLSSIERLDPATLAVLIADAETRGLGVPGVRVPVEDEDADEPWILPPSRRRDAEPLTGPLPSHVDAMLADGVYIDRSELPPPLVARLVRVAAFQNPEFYRAQAMRLSTFGKPRIISCAQLHPHHVGLPRGCLDEALELLQSHGIETRIVDRREAGTPLATRFPGHACWRAGCRAGGAGAPRLRRAGCHDGIRQDGDRRGADCTTRLQHTRPCAPPAPGRAVGRAAADVPRVGRSRHRRHRGRQAQAERSDRRRADPKPGAQGARSRISSPPTATSSSTSATTFQR